MKQTFMKSFVEAKFLFARCLTLLILALLSTNIAWGETATITFANQTSGTSDGTTAYTTSNFVSSGIASSDEAFGTITCSETTKCYSGKIGYGLKAGGSSDKGSFTISFTALTNVTKIVLSRASYNDSKTATITVKNGETTLADAVSTPSGSADFSDMEITGLNISSLSTLTVNTSKYCYIKSITITYSATEVAVKAPTFTPAAGNYMNAQSIELSCTTEGAAIYYTTDDTEPSAESTPYESAISVNHSMTIKAIAIKGDDKSSVATAAYKITTYTSLADLVADGDPGKDGYPVTVTLNNERITGFYTSSNSDERHGVYLKVGDKTIEIYCNATEVPNTWIEGGTVSGTLNCDWKNYKETWELCPSDWSALSYTAPTTYNITIADGITNGTVTADMETAAAGVEVTLTVTPNNGYKLGTLTVKDAAENDVDVTDYKFTMPASDVTVSATFAEIPTYTVTWSVNGATSTETLEEGAAINFKAPTINPSTIGNKVFRGWATAAIDGVAITEPSYVTSAKCYANVTYYAVFADEEVIGDEFYKVTTTLTAGKTYIFGAVKAAASSTLADNTTFGAVAFTNTYNDKNNNWGQRVDLTPDTDGKIAADNESITDECEWLLESIDDGNYKFKKGTNYLYLGTSAGSTSGAQSGISTTGNCYIENVNSTCKDAFLLHPSSSSTNIMLYNTNSGYRMYAPRDYSNTMTPYVRFYEYDSGKTYSNFITTYVAPAGYKVILSQVTGGTISADKVDGLKENDEVTLSYELTSGYSFVKWTVLDGNAEEVTVTDNKFKMPASDVEVKATFAPIAVENITLNKSELALETGVSETLTVTITPDDALVQDVTWASSNTAVATVDETGKVTAIAVGTANISATSNNGKVGTCLVTVTVAIPWVKVTSEPTDWSGEYLLVYENEENACVWTGVDAANCYASATIADDLITKPSGAVSLTIAPMEGGYSILVNGGDNNGKYIYGTSGSNTVNFGTTASANTLAYSDGNVTITSNTSTIMYNSSSSDNRFRYYKSGSSQKAVQLYRKSAEVTISDAGAATYSNSEALDFTDSEVNAYVALDEAKGTAITMTKVEKVAANTGLYIKGEEGTYYIPIAASGTDYSSTNKLKAVVTATTVEPTEGGLYNYVLQSQNGDAGFYYLTEAREIGANKAYLQLNSQIGNDAKVELLFNDEPTGIKSLTPALSEGMGVYNLNGMRVNGSYKGIVIMNGKKYLNK